MTTNKRKDLLLEIGCEELPPAVVADARAQLSRLTEKLFAENRLPLASVAAFATPRRLVVVARGVPPRQEREVKSVVGPPKSAAYDADGKLTPAGRGFLKKWSVKEEDLRFDSTPKGEYLAAAVASPQREASDVLADVIPAIIARLSFPRTMTWPQSDAAFPRPVRWLVCLYAGEVVAFEYAGLTAGSESFGHRTIAPGPKDLSALFDEDGLIINDEALQRFYEKELGVVVDVADRRARVVAQLKKAGAPPGYFDDADYHIKWTFERVLDEAEAPSLVGGEFDAKYLTLPAEVVEAAMLGYLHLFPILNKKGELEPRFFAVHNARPEAEDNVRAGLERVLAARLADAAYFWEVDRQTPLDEMAAALAGVVFAEGAGTLADKAARLRKWPIKLIELHAWLGIQDWLSDNEINELERAAALCKADLASQMVREKEFTHLQGTMGRLYAEAAGEPQAVAEAVGEHYRPVAADDPLPASKLGRILALADRLDTLVVLFAAGHRPTRAKDPFGLRRAGIGVCRLLIEDTEGLFSHAALENLVAIAASLARVNINIDKEVEGFLRDRLMQIFLNRGFRDDMIKAIIYPPQEDGLPLTYPAENLTALEKKDKEQRALEALKAQYETLEKDALKITGEESLRKVKDNIAFIKTSLQQVTVPETAMRQLKAIEISWARLNPLKAYARRMREQASVFEHLNPLASYAARVSELRGLINELPGHRFFGEQTSAIRNLRGFLERQSRYQKQIGIFNSFNKAILPFENLYRQIASIQKMQASLNPYGAVSERLERLKGLTRKQKNRAEYSRLIIAFKRPINILRQARQKGLLWGSVEKELLKEKPEKALYKEYKRVEPKFRNALNAKDYELALTTLAEMRPAVDTFFDEVMVMCEDERLRSNRLALMQLLADLFLSFADFTKLRGEEEYE